MNCRPTSASSGGSNVFSVAMCAGPALAIAAALTGYGARPWQTGLTAVPIAKALLRIIEKGDE